MSDISARALEGDEVDARPGSLCSPTPAATVVCLRDGDRGPEVLLLRRRSGGAFSGMWVFPGGKVEPGDRERPWARRDDPSGEAGADVAVARTAAVREAAEEAGLALSGNALVVHSFWVPPPEAPRRFATWFFVTPVAFGPGPGIVVDRAEVHEHRWVRPSAAIAEREAGRLALAPPTWVTLWQLAPAPDVGTVLAEAAGRPPRRFVTRMAPTPGGGSVLYWEGDEAWSDGDLDRAGPRRRLWVSPEEPWRAESPAAGA